jgi:hypothetical protein
MSAQLLDEVIAETGGRDLWSTVRSLKAAVCIGGPIWAAKGWPQGSSFDQTMTIDTRREHIEFAPFARPDRRMVFDAAADSVHIHTNDGSVVDVLELARAAFKGMLRNSSWDIVHLGYFLGYACWNYFTTPFLFTHPGVNVEEIAPWQEAGQTWRRPRVNFPATIATHSSEQVFYCDSLELRRRMDYVTTVNGSTLVDHYSGRYRNFAGRQWRHGVVSFDAIPITPSISTFPRSPSTLVTSS